MLRISHSAAVSAYRERERHLAALLPVELMLVMPEKWEHLGGKSDDIKETFPVITSGTIGTGSIPLFAFDPFVLVKALRDFQPDIVDIHEEPYSVSCFQSLWLTGAVAPRAACVFYSAQNILKRYPPPFSWTEKYVYSKASGAYPCSDTVREVLCQKGFSKPAPVIPLGVDRRLFQPVEGNRRHFGIGENCFVVGYFGRFEECKGVDYVLEALAAQKVDWKIIMVGRGAYQDALRTKASCLGIADRVLWLGEKPIDEIPGLLCLCDTVVVPSITTRTWREQFGRVVVEAMACGVPVIATNSGSLPEVVEDAGFIVPEKDSAALSEKLNEMASNSELRMKFRRRGLELVESKYTWARVAELTRDLYVRALQSRSCR